MCTAVRFDATFDCERNFVKDLLAKKCEKKTDFLNRCRPFMKILSGCTNNEKELRFVTATGLPGEAVENISGYAQS